MATFWERAAYSFYHMFSMYFDLGILILVISHFGFEGGTLVQIASLLLLPYLVCQKIGSQTPVLTL